METTFFHHVNQIRYVRMSYGGDVFTVYPFSYFPICKIFPKMYFRLRIPEKGDRVQELIETPTKAQNCPRSTFGLSKVSYWWI